MAKRTPLLLALCLAQYGVQLLGAGTWSGSIEAHVDLDTPQYSRHETQTWTLTGAAPTMQGSIALYPATWHYTGVGSSVSTSVEQPGNLNWVIEASGNVQIAIFVRASDNRLTFHQWSIPLYVANGLVVTKQTIGMNGGPPTTTTTKYGVSQWTLAWIEDDPTKTNVSGSDGTLVTAPPLPTILFYSGATAPTATCTWQFNYGLQAPSTINKTLQAKAVLKTPSATGTKIPVNTNPPPAKSAQDPVNFKAAQTGEGQVALSWDAVPGVTTYLVLGPGATEGTKVNATTTTVTGIPVGAQKWLVTSWYSPDGSRTSAQNWPAATLTVVSNKSHYRITAMHVVINHEENDDVYKSHGKINEIFATSIAHVFDRRNDSVISRGSLQRTPIHGDTNANDAVNGIRIRAGSVSATGGIQTGDDVQLLNSPASASTGYTPFVLWEGDLTSGVDVVVIRPMIWAAGGSDQTLYTPYTNRVSTNEAPTDVLKDPMVQTSVGQPTSLTVGTATQLMTNGSWSFNVVRPFGIVLTSPAANANVGLLNPLDPTDNHTTLLGAWPGVWKDRVLVLTREKLEAFLAKDSAKNLQYSVNGGWTATAPVPLGAYTLYIQIQRM